MRITSQIEGKHTAEEIPGAPVALRYGRGRVIFFFVDDLVGDGLFS